MPEQTPTAEHQARKARADALAKELFGLELELANATRPDAMASQVSGDHYKSMAIQPTEFCQRNQLTWCEANAVKYVCRHRAKNGADDIHKAIHYLEMLLELEYPT